MRGTFFIFLVALLSTSSISCTDEVAFHPEEVQLRKKFLAITLGITESQLQAELGKPNGRIVYDRSKHRYLYSELEGTKRLVEIDSGWFAASTHIPAAYFFESKDLSENVLVYNEATVFGYFYFSREGLLVDRNVVIS
ncbi:MAG: hypothetical protein MRJ66_19785 [Nitrospira sp.]|nr:hypothetical protein [Nitrospira sp.]